MASLGRVFVAGFFLFRLGRKILQRDLDHFGDVVAMRRGDRQRFAQAQLEEFGGDLGARHAFGLVDQQQDGLAGLAQLFGDDRVLRRAAGAAVDQEHHHIGFVHRLAALLGHLEHDAFLGDRLQPAGIHHQIGSVPYPAAPVMAIAGQPRQIGDQRVAAAREAIEQGGLAHIRTTDQNNCGQHSELKLIGYISSTDQANTTSAQPPRVCTSSTAIQLRRRRPRSHRRPKLDARGKTAVFAIQSMQISFEVADHDKFSQCVRQR